MQKLRLPTTALVSTTGLMKRLTYADVKIGLGSIWAVCHSISLKSKLSKYQRVPTAVRLRSGQQTSADRCTSGSSQVKVIHNATSTAAETVNVPNVDVSCFDSCDKTIREFWAKTSEQFSRVWESFHEISREAKTDRELGKRTFHLKVNQAREISCVIMDMELRHWITVTGT